MADHESDDELLERYPWGAIDHDNKEQWRGFLRCQLLVNRCHSCGYWFDPPRPMCPKCWSPEVEPTAVSGRGHVVWFTLLFQGAPGASPDAPVPAAVVELEEQLGLRVASTLVDCDPGAVRCDDAVELVWRDLDEAPLPAFTPRRS